MKGNKIEGKILSSPFMEKYETKKKLNTQVHILFRHVSVHCWCIQICFQTHNISVVFTENLFNDNNCRYAWTKQASILATKICKLAFPNYYHVQPLKYHIVITIMVIKAIQLINIYAHSQQQEGRNHRSTFQR
jgi:hypothetical protein